MGRHALLGSSHTTSDNDEYEYVEYDPECNSKEPKEVTVASSLSQVQMKGVGERENKVSGYSAEERLGTKDTPDVMLSEPRGPEKEYSVSSILKELAAIQQQGPQKYCV